MFQFINQPYQGFRIVVSDLIVNTVFYSQLQAALPLIRSSVLGSWTRWGLSPTHPIDSCSAITMSIPLRS